MMKGRRYKSFADGTTLWSLISKPKGQSLLHVNFTELTATFAWRLDRESPKPRKVNVFCGCLWLFVHVKRSIWILLDRPQASGRAHFKAQRIARSPLSLFIFPAHAFLAIQGHFIQPLPRLPGEHVTSKAWPCLAVAIVPGSVPPLASLHPEPEHHVSAFLQI